MGADQAAVQMKRDAPQNVPKSAKDAKGGGFMPKEHDPKEHDDKKKTKVPKNVVRDRSFDRGAEDLLSHLFCNRTHYEYEQLNEKINEEASKITDTGLYAAAKIRWNDELARKRMEIQQCEEKMHDNVNMCGKNQQSVKNHLNNDNNQIMTKWDQPNQNSREAVNDKVNANRNFDPETERDIERNREKYAEFLDQREREEEYAERGYIDWEEEKEWDRDWTERDEKMWRKFEMRLETAYEDGVMDDWKDDEMKHWMFKHGIDHFGEDQWEARWQQEAEWLFEEYVRADEYEYENPLLDSDDFRMMAGKAIHMMDADVRDAMKDEDWERMEKRFSYALEEGNWEEFESDYGFEQGLINEMFGEMFHLYDDVLEEEDKMPRDGRKDPHHGDYTPRESFDEWMMMEHGRDWMHHDKDDKDYENIVRDKEAFEKKMNELGEEIDWERWEKAREKDDDKIRRDKEAFEKKMNELGEEIDWERWEKGEMAKEKGDSHIVRDKEAFEKKMNELGEPIDWERWEKAREEEDDKIRRDKDAFEKKMNELGEEIDWERWEMAREKENSKENEHWDFDEDGEKRRKRENERPKRSTSKRSKKRRRRSKRSFRYRRRKGY